MQFIATCGCQGAVLESNSHILYEIVYLHLYIRKTNIQPNGGGGTYTMTMEHIWDLVLVFPPKKTQGNGQAVVAIHLSH